MSSPDETAAVPDPHARVEAWRHRLGIGGTTIEGATTLEAAQSLDPTERIELARDRMRRVVIDRFGGDPVLIEGIKQIVLSAEEAVAMLEDEVPPPVSEHLSALEAVVAFDGSRPSFLLREDTIDFETSYTGENSYEGRWRTTLDPHLAELRAFASCVGRVELGETHVGTAFLISPTLAMTNRHVAQGIADVAAAPMELFGPAFVDFGREHGCGRASYDRREVERIVCVGAQEIPTLGVDHTRLDVALLSLKPTTLVGREAHRFLPISARSGALPSDWLIGAVGYPSKWRSFVPAAFRNQYEAVLTRLLDGDAGTKRFAPGITTGMVAGAPEWSMTHDATTINGNSGSPMATIRQGTLKVTGLHYGGQWGGERTNWAHVLGNCGEGVCNPANATLQSVLAEHGISL